MLLFPISFMLIFRSNVAFARYWEGCGHYNRTLHALRSLSRRSFTFIKDTSDEEVDIKSGWLRQNTMRMLMVLSICVRQNLRKRSVGAAAHQDNLDMVSPYLTEPELTEYASVVKNRPLLVMCWLGKYIHEAHLAGKLEGGTIMMAFDTDISLLLEGWMGMQKVCYQPMPYPHIHMCHWFVLLWCASLPMYLVQDVLGYGWWTVMISPVIAVALYAIEEVAQEMEDPFGDDLNDLPTEEFENGLRRDARLVMGGDRTRGTRGMHFKSLGDDPDKCIFGMDFSPPMDYLKSCAARVPPVHHLFGEDCRCASCVLGRGTLHVSRRERTEYTELMAAQGESAANHGTQMNDGRLTSHDADGARLASHSTGRWVRAEPQEVSELPERTWTRSPRSPR
eukprot:TRINITY_DN15833_c0_g1_i7.p1 TRINITY_DN15833_c0_g1~~TRINITY_DN15833_c0_g1_i7.p1  ORF type:complete len:393 (+),score=66.01 TRINITY_DN15833_c0_g1_i7:174-1352(+)